MMHRRILKTVSLLTCLLLAACDGGGAGPPAGMLFIPGGCYRMGDFYGDGWRHERPLHTVCLSGFYMDETEVTQAAYAAVTGVNPSRYGDCGADCPVERADWFMARDYCAARGKRLPTEAEFEYVMRNGGKVVYYANGQNELTREDANFQGGPGQPSPVKSYPPNELGLYDIGGNVWEWVSDFYGYDYYAVSPERNPQGPTEGSVDPLSDAPVAPSSGEPDYAVSTMRVVRGGSFDHARESMRAAFRYALLPDGKGYDNGFRCAQSIVSE